MDREKADLGVYSKYLRSVLSNVLSKIIAEIIQKKPRDPILYLAQSLRRHGRQQRQQGTQISERHDRVSKHNNDKMTDKRKNEDNNYSTEEDMTPSSVKVHEDCTYISTDIGDLFDDDDIS